MKSKYIKKAENELSPRAPDVIKKSLANYMRMAYESNDRIAKEGVVVRDLKGSVVAHPAIKVYKDVVREIAKIIQNHGRYI